MLNVIMLSVVLPSVAAPIFPRRFTVSFPFCKNPPVRLKIFAAAAFQLFTACLSKLVRLLKYLPSSAVSL